MIHPVTWAGLINADRHRELWNVSACILGTVIEPLSVVRREKEIATCPVNGIERSEVVLPGLTCVQRWSRKATHGRETGTDCQRAPELESPPLQVGP
jgi:hypothetical protein